MPQVKSLPTITSLRSEVSELRRTGARIGFVPTMGYLHEGHLSLVELSRQHSDKTIVSIFVNPTQFNNPSDLEKYPRDLPRDCAMLEKAGAFAVFLPDASKMYSKNHETWVDLAKLPQGYEGADRPGHFRGVSTVVSMLFNLVQPDIAVFGEKDFQQLRIIERMVDDLKFPLKIIRGPLVREPDGLAMSSRNVRLDRTSRMKALHLSKGLFAAQAAYRAGESDPSQLRSVAMKFLSGIEALEVNYLEVIDEEHLMPAHTATNGSRMLATVTVGGVRLLDNIPLRR